MVMTLSILSGALFVLLGISVYFNVKLGITILRVQDSIEETLDILDERYESISKILEIPLYNDSPEIRKIHKDIELCRDAVLFIANRLISIDSELEDGLKEEGDSGS